MSRLKLELLAAGGAPDSQEIVTITTIGPNGEQGIVVEGNEALGTAGVSKACAEAVMLIETIRPALREKLGREPNGEELLVALQGSDHGPRLRKV